LLTLVTDKKDYRSAPIKKDVPKNILLKLEPKLAYRN